MIAVFDRRNMKIHSIGVALVLISGFSWIRIENSSCKAQSSFQSKLPEGIYVLDTKDQDVWYDSVSVVGNTLSAFRNHKYGYGRIFIFTYDYQRIEKEYLLLTALSMNPEGVYVYPEQYDWHNDTMRIRFSSNGTTRLIGPNKEEFKLNSAKPKLD